MTSVVDQLLPAETEDLLGEFEARFPGDAAGEIRLMEHLGAMAARTESEAEAEAFLGALAPLAARLLPAAAKAVPALARATVSAGRRLWNSPAARPYVQALPHVVRRTAADVARSYSRGAPVSADLVTRRFAAHTSRALREPDRRRQVLQRARVADRRWIAEARRRAQQAQQAQQARRRPPRPGGPAPRRSVVVNGQRWCRC